MITKERLLDGMNEMVYVEEGMVTFFANFSKALIEETEELKKEDKNEMKKLLTRLYVDSSKHKEYIGNLVEKVEKSRRDEY